jgi:hypothetical protein
MLTLFGKKKLTEDKVANVFVNALQVMIDEGFTEVAGLINDSPEFVKPPSIDVNDSGAFTMIVLAGNIQRIPNYFDSGQDKRITEHILEKFSELYEINKMELAENIGETRKFMSRKNHPSKNTLNAMAKAVFCKYGLNEYQEEYFKSLQAPNPILIQRLKDALENFLWDWEALTTKYRIVRYH